MCSSVQQTRDKGFIVLASKYVGYLHYDGILIKIEPEDHIPPLVNITYPQKGLYIFNTKLLDLPRNTILFGKANIQIEAVDNLSGIDYIEVSIGNYPNATVFTLIEEPFSLTWNRIVFGKYPINVIAFDKAGNMASDNIEVWKFF